MPIIEDVNDPEFILPNLDHSEKIKEQADAPKAQLPKCKEVTVDRKRRFDKNCTVGATSPAQNMDQPMPIIEDVYDPEVILLNLDHSEEIKEQADAPKALLPKGKEVTVDWKRHFDKNCTVGATSPAKNMDQPMPIIEDVYDPEVILLDLKDEMRCIFEEKLHVVATRAAPKAPSLKRLKVDMRRCVVATSPAPNVSLPKCREVTVDRKRRVDKNCTVGATRAAPKAPSPKRLKVDMGRRVAATSPAPKVSLPKCREVTVDRKRRFDKNCTVGATRKAYPNECPFCKKTFKSNSSMRKHKSVMHHGPSGTPLKIWCNPCEKNISINNIHVHERTREHKMLKKLGENFDKLSGKD